MTDSFEVHRVTSGGPGAVPRRVAVVGGGLAGLAAAVALVERGLEVEIFEGAKNLFFPLHSSRSKSLFRYIRIS